MKRQVSRFGALAALALAGCLAAQAGPRRIVVIKVDGLPEELLERRIDQLPWIRRVFVKHGAWVRNFYVRGISLSAPSWSMLDSGQHMVIRGNAEFDRFRPHVYDYLNFFPFYVRYARSKRVDMPEVEVLDEAGIPLLSDSFPRDQTYTGMQLYQRGVHWGTLADSLRRKMERPVKDLIDDWQTGFDMAEGVERQQERELIAALADPRVIYLDYFTGDVDHTMHLTNDPASVLGALERLDATVGRIWTAIQKSPLAAETVMVMVSDHGMNSTPEVYSQGYNLVHFFNSEAGGGHHVISTRHPLSEYKLRGLDPFVSSVVTPSPDSFYLEDKKDWATAMLDLDGNERASIQLRNSDLNEIQILMEKLKRGDPDGKLADGIVEIVDRNRAQWSATAASIEEELAALRRAMNARHPEGKSEEARRMGATLDSWRSAEHGYAEYAAAMRELLALRRGGVKAGEIQLPRNVLGESNTVEQLAHYTVGPARQVNYFEALTDIRVRNVVQKELGAKPVDFVAAPTPDGIFLYADSQHGALIESRMEAGELWLRYMPVCGLERTPAEWGPGFPLRLFEDADLRVPGDRKDWLSAWHSEREWFQATYRTRYSNGLIGLQEYFAPWEPAMLPAVFQIANERDWPLLRRFAGRLRDAVRPDLLVLASDHWNFNVRGFNPGGNHGSFFSISTHSVFLAAGGGVPEGLRVESPYDSLSFVPTLLALMERRADYTYPGPVIHELMRR